MDAKEGGYQETRGCGDVDMEEDGEDSWTEKISNEEVLRRVGEESQLMSLIQTRKMKWIGHSIRGWGL